MSLLGGAETSGRGLITKSLHSSGNLPVDVSHGLVCLRTIATCESASVLALQFTPYELDGWSGHRGEWGGEIVAVFGL